MTMATISYAHALERIEKSSALSKEELAKIVGASSRSVSRWATGTGGPRARARDRLLELHAVVSELSQHLTSEGVNLWLHAPNPFLDYDRPTNVLAKGEFRRVLAAIDALGEGVFV